VFTEGNRTTVTMDCSPSEEQPPVPLRLARASKDDGPDAIVPQLRRSGEVFIEYQAAQKATTELQS